MRFSTPPTSHRAPVITGAAFLAAGMLLLSGCASQEPNAPTPELATKTVRVAVHERNAEEAMLGHLYAQALNRRGRSTEIVPLHDASADSEGWPWDLVAQGRADVVVGCTGAVLEHTDPKQAAALSSDLRKEKAKDWSPTVQQEWRDTTYQAMVSTLPGDVDAADPSSNTTCSKDGAKDLPNSVVPIYHQDVLNRNQRRGMNWVSGSLSNAQLQQLVEQAKQRDPSEVASSYLDEIGMH